MSVDERVSKVERKVSSVEEAIKLLSQLIASHDDRLVHSFENDEDMNEKTKMLIDAQIRNEDKWQESKDRWEKSNEEFNVKMTVLAERQTKSNEELNAKIAVLVDNQTRNKE